MRAVVLDANGLPELTELSEPTGAGELVHVTACGLCGSDVEKLGRPSHGVLLGHEIVGVREDGARVTVLHRVPCGSCSRCLAGHETTCDEFGTARIAPGGFAERLRATHTLRLPDELGGYDGIWIEPLACVLRAAETVPLGDVLVVGCGAIGLLWVQVLLRRGDTVRVLEPRPDRRSAARALGARDAGRVSSAVVTAHRGIADALRLVEPGGTILVFAAAPGEVPVSLETVYRRELTMLGSRSATPQAFDAAVALLPELELPAVTPLPLGRFEDGVRLYRSGETLKVVFTP
ncbi:MAG TPA: alcohol dehydrogenase catalytic domain-containing protein [Gaiellaceae bacterium]|nr:alcohol dehydrogenase catalytic domain-containing protein [Gaiellaceae bacterium]